MTAVDPEGPRSAAPTPARRVAWWLAAGMAVVAVAAGGLYFGQPSTTTDPSSSPSPSSPKPAPKPAPAIDLPALAGEGRVSLASLRGRPVVVNLFASWCTPCRKELPAFAAVAGEEERVAFLGVNHQDNRTAGQEMVAEFRLPYPSGYDPDGRVAADYGLIGMPTTLFIGPDGSLLDTHTGELSRTELERAISHLFGIS